MTERNSRAKINLEDEEAFLDWTKKLKVPQKEVNFSVLIEEHAKERRYRKVRKENDVIKQLPVGVQVKIKLPDTPAYRSTLDIDVSDGTIKRAYLFMDYFIKSVTATGGHIDIDQSKPNDNTRLLWPDCIMTCKLYEKRVRNGSRNMQKRSMRPAYELIPTGELVFEVILPSGEKICYQDDDKAVIENRIGDIFGELYPIVKKEQISAEIRKQEECRRHEEEWLEWERKDAVQKEQKRIEEEKKREEEIKEEIWGHIQNWNRIKQAEVYVSDLRQIAYRDDFENKELLQKYCALVEQVYNKEKFISKLIKIEYK